MYKRRPDLILAMGIGLGLVAAATISACSQHYRSSESVFAAAATEQAPVIRNQVPTIVDAENQRSLERLLDALNSKQAIFAGETHNRYDHHLNQLTVIRGLHERGVDLAVGMEFFQEPFQPYLDEYVAGKIDEKTLLKKTEYFERWRFDYRLYRDILTYARDNGIPLIALNAPSELVAQVSEKGIAGLGPEDRVRLPQDLKPAGSAYEDRLHPIFAMHGKTSEERFRRFVDVQLLWDEHMARVARDYLFANPTQTLVVLAGSGHVAYPDAIPGRLARMIVGDSAVVVTGDRERFADGSIDFVFAERDIALAPPGRLGVELAGVDSVVKIREVRTAGPADKAGLRPGDQMLRINGEQVEAVEDVRLALLDKRPGELCGSRLHQAASRIRVEDTNASCGCCNGGSRHVDPDSWRKSMARAIWNDTVIAESTAFEEVEGNIYFPADSVRSELLRESATRTRCAWKGEAHYYDVLVDGKRNADAAWFYPDPNPAASRIKNHIAFWHGVRVEG